MNNKATVQKFMDAYNRLDHAAILSCLTDDVEWFVPGAFRIQGQEAFDREIEHDDFVGAPKIRVIRLTEENDVVVCEGTVQTESKVHGKINLLFSDVFTLRDGKIRQLISYLVNVDAETVAAVNNA